MWSYLETHMENINLAKFEGVNDFSQSFPDIFRFGDQNRFVLAVAGSKMQIAYGEMDIPYVEHKKYYFPLVRNQYDALDKNEMLEEVIHKGGHEFSPNEVISFFKETLK